MTVKVIHSARLMQDFLPVRPVDATNDLRAVRVNDRPLVFSIGTDNVLYLIYQHDDNPGQGWTRRALLGLPDNAVVTAFGAAQDPADPTRFRLAAAVLEGNVPVLCCTDAIDFDIVDWNSPSAIASLWRIVHLPDRSSTGNEVRIDRTGKVLLATSTPSGPSKYYLYDPQDRKLNEYELPEAGARIHQMALGSLLGLSGVFLLYDVGTTDRTLLFTSFPHPVYNRTIKRRYDISGVVNDFFVVPNAGGYDTVYTCGDNVYAFDDPSDRQVIVSGGDVVYNQIRAVTEDTKVTLWLQGTRKGSLQQGLYYITNQFNLGGVTNITRWTTPLIMMKDVAVFACEKQSFISNHLFAVTPTATLQHLYQDADTTLWRKEVITLEDTGAAEEISAYVVMAEFTGLDTTKTNRVKVSATSTVYASVNESNVIIGPRKTVWVDLGVDAEICVTIPVEDIAAPDVTFSADFIPGGSLTVDCTERVMNELASFGSGEALRDAKDATGQPIFTDPKDTPDVSSLDAVAKATKEIVSQSQSLRKDTTVASRSLNSANGNARAMSKRICIKADENGVSMHEEHLSDREPELLTRGLFDAGGSSIGDFFHAIKEGLIVAKNWFVEVVQNGIKIALEIGGKVLTFVANRLEQVAAFFGPLFEMVKVYWDKLKKFISFLFNFGDIVKCKDVLVGVVNYTLDFAKSNVRNLKSITNKIADDAKVALGAGKLNDTLEKAVGSTTFTDQQGSANSRDDARSPEADSSESKWMQRKVKQASKQEETSFADIASDIAENVVKIFTDTWENMKFAFGKLKTLIEQLVAGKVGIADFILEVLKLVGAIVIDSAQNVANLIFDIFDAAITVLKEILNYKLRIPIISTLLEKMIPGVKFEASILDVVCFIAAVPTTVIYKLVTNRAPHEDITMEMLKEGFELAKLQDDNTPWSSTEAAPRSSAFATAEVGSRDLGALLSVSNKKNKPSRGALGIVGGSIGVIRSLTMLSKIAMGPAAPKWLLITDLILALMATALGVVVVGLLFENKPSQWFGIVLGSVAVLAFVWGAIETATEKGSGGWVMNGLLTVLGVGALVRFAIYIAGNADALLEAMALLGGMNWVLAAVQHACEKGERPWQAVGALRCACVLSSSGYFISYSSIVLKD